MKSNILKGLLALIISIAIFITSPIWIMQVYVLIIEIGWQTVLMVTTCILLMLGVLKAEA